MKKVKYYYSEPVHMRLLPVITNAEGEPLYIPETTPVEIKNLPRITVASVWDTEEDTITFGSTVCAPKDMFKKSIGREIAYKRAIESAEIIIRLTKRNRIRDVSKRYANQIIEQHLHKHVQSKVQR